MTSDYEPRRLPRLVVWVVTLMTLIGALITLVGLAGAAALVWQAVVL